jgi:hypothetical protein
MIKVSRHKFPNVSFLKDIYVVSNKKNFPGVHFFESTYKLPLHSYTFLEKKYFGYVIERCCYGDY